MSYIEDQAFEAEIDRIADEELLSEIQVLCNLPGYSKSKAIRVKDEMHSKSSNEFFYYPCAECGKYHVEMTGRKRTNAIKRRSSSDETPQSET